MSKHTPGPWEAKTFLVVATSLPRGVYGGLEICHTGIMGNKNVEENEANARLIAAAPDLLEACKFLCTQIRVLAEVYFPEEQERWLERCDSLGCAKRAIAKAEG